MLRGRFIKIVLSLFFNNRNATTGKASFILLIRRCSDVQDLLICQVMKRGSEN